MFVTTARGAFFWAVMGYNTYLYPSPGLEIADTYHRMTFYGLSTRAPDLLFLPRERRAMRLRDAIDANAWALQPPVALSPARLLSIIPRPWSDRLAWGKADGRLLSSSQSSPDMSTSTSHGWTAILVGYRLPIPMLGAGPMVVQWWSNASSMSAMWPGESKQTVAGPAHGDLGVCKFMCSRDCVDLSVAVRPSANTLLGGGGGGGGGWSFTLMHHGSECSYRVRK
jgi:hypothetical protein